MSETDVVMELTRSIAAKTEALASVAARQREAMRQTLALGNEAAALHSDLSALHMSLLVAMERVHTAGVTYSDEELSVMADLDSQTDRASAKYLAAVSEMPT